MPNAVKYLIKLVIIGGLVIFALFNYRILSLEKGVSKREMEGKSFESMLYTVTNITKIEYYKRPFAKADSPNDPPRPSNQPNYMYNVYIVTTNDAYLVRATEDDIALFSVAGFVKDNYTPNKITPIPFYVEIIIGFIILIIPHSWKKKKKNSDED